MNNNKTVLYTEHLFWPFHLFIILAAMVFITAFLVIYICYDSIPLDFINFWVISIPFLMALPFANFTILQLEVTDKNISLGFGVLKEKISFNEVQSVEVYNYSIKECFNWMLGISLINKIKAYNVFGDKFRGVMITYNTNYGLNKIFISSRNPQKVVEIINKQLKILNQ